MSPQVLTRPEWGARQPLSPWTPWPAGQPTGHTVHWEGAGGHADHSMCVIEVRSIQLFHQRTGYIDIAYHWIVCMHGVIFEGRPMDHESAAQRDGNRTHIAICYMAGPQWPLTQAARASIGWLIMQQPASAVAIGHRDEPSCSTSCPGDEVEAFVHSGSWRSMVPPSSVPVTPEPQKPLPSTGFHHPTLSVRSAGPAVVELQVKLDYGAGQQLKPDGEFGNRTDAAVRNFQRFFKLRDDGVAGPQTWSMLDFVIYMAQHRH